MLFDTHAHLHFKHFNKDREAVIERSKQKLEGVVEVGVNSNTNKKVLDLAAKYPKFLYPALGLHPTDASAEDLDLVKQQVVEAKDLVAVGEIGLDYYHCTEQSGRNVQQKLFKQMLVLAKEVKLPVIIHSREAEAEALNLLSSFEGTVIMHCFSGTTEQAKESLDRGYWISIPTTVCFSTQKQDLAKEIPLESLLLETDCPFLSPIKRTRNEPINVEMAAKTISQLLNISFDQVCTTTTKNAKRAFKL